MKKNRINKTEAIFMLVLTMTIPIVFTALQPEIKNNEIVQNTSVDFFSRIIQRVISFFDLIPSVYAEDFGCCSQTIQGAKCVQSTQSECISGKWAVNQSCQDICKTGCCIDSQGLCSKNAASLACPVPPATKFIADDLNCEQSPLCQEGCCTKGISKFWSTNVTCSGQGGLWDSSVPDEPTCLLQAYQEQYGCCRSYGGCEYITENECEVKAGSFSLNQKCYENVPNCNCELKSTGKCVDGYPDLYKEDTCGNVYVNITPLDSCSSKNQYCNSEKSPNQCDVGDCYNIYKNNVNGDFGPKQSTDTAKNGDAWCVYDTQLNIENGTAPMGSRYWRAYCLNGKQYVDQCEDYKQQICAEIQCISKEGSSTTAAECSQKDKKSDCESAGCFWFPNKQAYCMTNNWKDCYNITNEKQCNEDGACFWWTDFAQQQKDVLGDNTLLTQLNSITNTNWKIFVKDTYLPGQSKRGDNDLPICLPKYPPGLYDGVGGFENREQICSLGSDICKYQEEWFGAKTVNSECVTDAWRIFRAQQCKSLGDCGSWVNWVGQNTTGFRILQVEAPQAGQDPANRTKREISIPTAYSNFINQAGNSVIGSSSLSHWTGKAERVLMYSAEILAVGVAVGLFAHIMGVVSAASALLSAGFFTGSLAAATHAALATVISVASIALAVVAAGAILILIAQFLPPGPGKGALEGLGAGLATFGTLVLSGAMALSWATAGVGLGVAALVFALYMLSYKEDFYYQQCNPSMPPTNGNDCHICNEDPNRPCSKYRCESLGTACQYNDSITVNINGNPVPYPIAESSCNAIQNDGLAPYITEIKVKDLQGNSYLVNPSTTQGPIFIDITKQDGTAIPEWTTLLVDIKLNEKGFCRYDFQNTLNISGMALPFDSTVLRQELKQQFVVNQQMPQFFVRCADVYQNANVLPYTFKFEAIQGPDLTPPVIIGTDRDYNNKFTEGTTQLNLWIYVNEPSQCRWDTSPDKLYLDMSPATQCTTEAMQGGLKCSTTLTDLQPGIINKFYIRCNDTSGNMDQQSYELALYPTPALKITSISPSSNDPPISGCELQSKVTLKVDTAEGADDGLAKCYWTYNSDYSEENVFDTDILSVAHHEENITIENMGSRTVYIECVDSSGSSVRDSTTFSVIEDNQPPFITRLYNSGQLTLVTNEPSICAYVIGSSSSVCPFNPEGIKTKTFSPGDFSLSHSLPWMDENQWYVKCYDKCDNVMPCTPVYPEEI